MEQECFAKIAKLKTLFTENRLTDQYIKKFLDANEGDVEATTTALKANLAWSDRIRNKKFSAKLDSILKFGWFGADKEGNEILFVLVSSLTEKSLAEAGETAELCDLIGVKLFSYYKKAIIEEDERLTVIVKIRELTESASNLASKVAKMAEQNFPELLHKCVFIDSPETQAAVKAVKPVLKAQTSSKIVFLKESELTSICANKYIPLEFGGEVKENVWEEEEEQSVDINEFKDAFQGLNQASLNKMTLEQTPLNTEEPEEDFKQYELRD